MGQVKKLWFLGGWPVDKVLQEQKAKDQQQESVLDELANEFIRDQTKKGSVEIIGQAAILKTMARNCLKSKKEGERKCRKNSKQIAG